MRIPLKRAITLTLAIVAIATLSRCGNDDGMSNNQLPGAVLDQSDGTTQVTEAGGSDTYTLKLNTTPEANVTIAITPDDQLDLGAGPATAISLTFTPANASTAQTVTIQAVDDDVIEADHTGTIAHLATSSDAIYDGLQFDLTADIVDNETSPNFATVQGTITFDHINMWPDSGEVQVTIWANGVWTEFGPMGPPATDPFTIERVTGQSQYHYQFIGLSEGVYSAIAVGWRHPDESLPPEERSSVLGVYLNDPNTVSTGLDIPNTPHNGPLPEAFLLGAGMNETAFDIRADFANNDLFFPPDD